MSHLQVLKQRKSEKGKPKRKEDMGNLRDCLKYNIKVDPTGTVACMDCPVCTEINLTVLYIGGDFLVRQVNVEFVKRR
jgi:hypothetical protein